MLGFFNSSVNISVAIALFLGSLNNRHIFELPSVVILPVIIMLLPGIGYLLKRRFETHLPKSSTLN